jgi:maltooligosyltrehalose trehalohydrolase
MAAALLLLAPHTPLLFMGEEYDENTPFQFFADFGDPELKKAVSEGRRSEFADFDFSEVPDPEDPQTFERSKLTWASADENREMMEWYRRLLQLRREHVLGHERRATVNYEDGVLTMRVPATKPTLVLECTLQTGAGLPQDTASAWKQVLDNNEDGYAIRVFVTS